MKRQEPASIIPIEVHPASWHQLPFKVLYEKPVPTWRDQEADVDFVKIIDRLIKERWKK